MQRIILFVFVIGFVLWIGILWELFRCSRNAKDAETVTAAVRQALRCQFIEGQAACHGPIGKQTKTEQ